jgi:subtilisin family serine protease
VTPWGVDRIGALRLDVLPEALDKVDLYILDTGVATADLNVVEQRDFTGEGAAGAHGFHVSGTAAARNNASGVVGVAPGVRVHSFGVLDANGQTELSTAVLALEEVRRRKLLRPARPVVVNMSFGADVGTAALNLLDDAVQAAVSAGVVVVVSAGNEGIDAATVTPAHAPDALTVGAYDEGEDFAPFSNFGPAVDLLAPGVDILSLGLGPGGEIGLASSSGTSMSAPHVAGAAALYLALHPRATPAEVRDALVRSARPRITGSPPATTNRALWLGDAFTDASLEDDDVQAEAEHD